MPIDFTKPLVMLEEKVAYLARQEEHKATAREGALLETLKSKVQLHISKINRSEKIDIKNGVAVVDIHGVLMEKADWFDIWWYGGVATTALTEKILQLMENPDVHTVVFDIDSPGGEIGGVQNLAAAIKSLADSGKKTIAYVNSLAASGGYWVASATDEIILSAETAQVGSIGVVIVHREVSELEKKVGVKTTEITAGKYKRAVSFYEKLSEEGRDMLAGRAHDYYTIFLEEVAKYNNTTVKKVMSYAEGQIFMGQKAVEIGIADKIEFVPNIFVIGGKTLDIEQLAKDHPQVYAQALQKGRDEGKADTAKEVDGAYQKGVEKERFRVVGIIDIKMDGYETAKASAIKDGTTTEQLSVSIVQGKVDRDKKPETSEKPEGNKPKDQAKDDLYGESQGILGQFENDKDGDTEASLASAVEAANKV